LFNPVALFPKKVAEAPQGGVSVKFWVGESVGVFVGRLVFVMVGVIVIVGVLVIVRVIVGVEEFVKVRVTVGVEVLAAKPLVDTSKSNPVNKTKDVNRKVVIEWYPD
jgi:hypothetical protein